MFFCFEVGKRVIGNRIGNRFVLAGRFLQHNCMQTSLNQFIDYQSFQFQKIISSSSTADFIFCLFVSIHLYLFKCGLGKSKGFSSQEYTEKKQSINKITGRNRTGKRKMVIDFVHAICVLVLSFYANGGYLGNSKF